MKWVWVHSMRFQRQGAEVFSEAQVAYRTWQRYLAHCDSLHVVGRGPEAELSHQAKYIKPCGGPGMTFTLVEGINSPREMLANTGRVLRQLEEVISQADGVIARLPSEHGLMAVAVARKLGKPFAVELVGCAQDALWFHGDFRGKVYAPIMARRVRAAVAAAPFVLYVTKEFLQRRYPASHVIGRASNVEIAGVTAAVSDVDVPAFSTKETQSENRTDPALQIGLIGAFQNEYKGHGTALRALRQVIDLGVPARLRLIGVGGTERWMAEARKMGVEGHVSFEGVLPPGEAVMKWLQDLDIYIQPSLTEGLPRALIEAMAAGRAAFASRVGGIPELLPCEYLHAPGDWKALAKMLVRAAQDPSWRLEAGQANRLKAREYASDILQERRGVFWSAFASFCVGNTDEARMCA
jgi:glycosyltransferase involved in cell wall biosynthesis